MIVRFAMRINCSQTAPKYGPFYMLIFQLVSLIPRLASILFLSSPLKEILISLLSTTKQLHFNLYNCRFFASCCKTGKCFEKKKQCLNLNKPLDDSIITVY